MTILTVPNAELIFEELIDRAAAGEEIFIDYDDGRLVQIVPVRPSASRLEQNASL